VISGVFGFVCRAFFMSDMSRLRWRCRRGTKELDIVMNRYFQERYETATVEEQASFNALLDIEDPIIFDWLMDKTQAEDENLKVLVEILKGIMAT
jgi:antitoxin CptB